LKTSSEFALTLGAGLPIGKGSGMFDVALNSANVATPVIRLFGEFFECYSGFNAARNGINQTRGTISPFLFLDDKYLSVENLKGLTCNFRLQAFAAPRGSG